MASSTRGVERVLAKCEACMVAGNYYEAHQMFRTVYFRYSGQHKYAEAAEILYQGALKLLQHNQFSSGADLSLLLLEVLDKYRTEVTAECIDQLASLFQKMDPKCPERLPYLTKAIKWTSKVNKEHRRGHPDLHQRFGVIFWQERNYAQSRYHYLHSSDGEGCAQMLLEFQLSFGYPSEIDLFIAQAVLQYLCLQNKQTANNCFEAYTRKHPAIVEGPPYSMPLLNFLWMLLLALERGKLTIFSVLCEKYQLSINRDPSYKEYLDQIGQLFFGVPPPQKTPQGFFGNILQSILGGGSDDESDDTASSPNGRPPTHKGADCATPRKTTLPPNFQSSTSSSSSKPCTPTPPPALDLD